MLRLKESIFQRISSVDRNQLFMVSSVLECSLGPGLSLSYAIDRGHCYQFFA